MDEAYDNWKIFLAPEQVAKHSPLLYGQEKDMLLVGSDTWYVGIVQSQPDFDVAFSVVTPSCRVQDPDTYRVFGANSKITRISSLKTP